MKRSLSVVLVLLMFASTTLFGVNSQTTYTVRDEVYRRVDDLCRRAGVLGPSTFSPVTGRVLVIALDRIDVESLGETDRAEYGRLYRSLTGENYLFEDDGFAFDIDAMINLEGFVADFDDFDYANTATGFGPDRRNESLLPYRYEDPFLGLGAKIDFGDQVALEVEYEIRNNAQMMYESSLGWLYSRQRTDRQGFYSTFAPEMPFRAGGSFGNDYISFIIGRYPHSMGGGITGNLAVGDNFVYQEIANLSFLSNWFSYNISVTRFDQQISYEVQPDGTGLPSATGDGSNRTMFSRSEFDGLQQFRVVHRFDLNLFDRFRFAVNLATIYNSTYGLDMRFFYPFVIGHNYYNYTNSIDKTYFDEANNLISLETEFVIIDGLTFSAQVAIDQFQMFFEGDDSVPPAYGALANLKYSTSLGDDSVFNVWFESVYTSPYLYLNGKEDHAYDSDGNETASWIDYNLDYVVGYHMQYLDDYGYSGYIYGPDSLVFSLGGDYSSYENRYTVGWNMLYRVRGEKGICHYVGNHQLTQIDMTEAHVESDSSLFMGRNTPSGGWDRAEHLLKASIYGRYNLPEYDWGQVTFYAAMGGNLYFNYLRVVGDTEFQPMMLFGVKWVF